jgi:hypothetical protein
MVKSDETHRLQEGLTSFQFMRADQFGAAFNKEALLPRSEKGNTEHIQKITFPIRQAMITGLKAHRWMAHIPAKFPLASKSNIP